MTTTEERPSRLEAGYEHLATKAGVEGLRAGLETLRADFHSILREVQAENNRRFDQINQRIDRLFWAIITIGGGLLAVAVAALVRDLL